MHYTGDACAPASFCFHLCAVNSQNLYVPVDKEQVYKSCADSRSPRVEAAERTPRIRPGKAERIAPRGTVNYGFQGRAGEVCVGGAVNNRVSTSHAEQPGWQSNE